MSQNPTNSTLYWDLTSGYACADGVINEADPFYVEYIDLTVDDGWIFDNDSVTKTVSVVIPEYFILDDWWCGVYVTITSKSVYVV